MKSFKLSLLVLIAFLSTASNASHVMGAQIYYKNIGKYKYEVYADYYRDCRGMAMSLPIYTIKGVSGCTTAKTDTFKFVSVTNITPTCAAAGQVCYPPNTATSRTGYEKLTYKVTVDLSSWAGSGCCQVLIGSGQCCRNAAITTGATNENFWVWCMIDLCKWYKNSSPVFLSEPLSIAICNQPLYLYNMAVDYKDNDSLAFELTDPMQDWTTKTSWSTGRSSKSPFTDYWPTGYNKSKGPDPTYNPPIGTYFDPATGSLIYTPTDCSEITISAVRINEYHKDSATGKYLLVGYITRDWQTWTSSGPNNYVPLINGPDNVYLLDSTESSFIYKSSDKMFISLPLYPGDNDDTVKLKMFDFKPLNNTNATFKILDSTQKQPIGKFTWKPMGMYNKMPYVAWIEARDNGCKYNAFRYKLIKVHVRKKAELAWVEGVAFMDINKNCKRDSFEYVLPGAYISANAGKDIVFTADSVGHFAGWILPDTCNFKVVGLYSSFACSKGLKIVAGKSYSFDLGSISGLQINGAVYRDTLKNCKADSLEPRLKNQFVYTVPGNYTASTDSKGQWQLNVPAAEYKILYSSKRPYTVVKCPTKPYIVNYYQSNTVKNIDYAIYDTSNITDVSASLLVNSWHRRGFNSNATLVVKNNGNMNVPANSVWIKFNKKLKYVSSSGYVSKTDSTIKFSVSALKPDDEVNFKLVLYADTATCKLGDTMTTRVWLDTTGLKNDFVKTNNYRRQTIKIVASVDPNEKQEHNTNGYAWRDENKLRYFVQFQNTGTDTAINITVVDTLNYVLLGRTLNFIGASHSYDYSINANVLKVNFPKIYLVDTSKSKDRSIGHFEFTIDIDPAINKEFKFSNRADIFFDFAKAVKTNKKYITYTSLVKAGPTDRTTYCGKDTITLAYSSKFSFKSGNKFKVMMSDSMGVFATGAKFIDSISSTSPNGSFKFAIPSSTPKGNLYRLKVISTNPSGPVYEEAISNSFALVSYLSKPTFSSMNQLYCGKDSIQLNINSTSKIFKVYDNSSLLFTTKSANPKYKFKVGNHVITLTAISGSCSAISDTLKFANDTLPVVNLTTPSHSNFKVCGNDSVTLEIDGGHKSFDLLGNSLVFIKSFNSNKAKVVIPNTNDERTAKVTSVLGCSNNSNTLKFTNIKKPSFSFTDSDADNELCKDDSVKFSVTGNNSIKFQLYKNNTAWLKKFRPSITSNDIKDGDLIKVMGTDTITGCADTSAPVKFGVTYFSVGLTCSDSDLIICSNVNITFAMSGATTYKLYKNNKFWTTPATNPITLFGINNNDEIYAEGTTKLCKYNSNKLKFKVNTPSIGLKIENSCIGDSLRLSFSGGVSYDLYKNSTFYKTFTTKTFASKDFANNDKIYLEGFDSFGCTNYSPTITVNYSTPPNISLTNPDTDNTTCRGENVNFNFSGGVSYNLFKNNSLWKSVSGNTITFNDAKDQDEFYTIGYNSTGCPNTSAKIKLTVKTANFVLTNSDPDNTICPNESITLSFSGGTKYDIYKNNTLLTANAKSPYTLNFIQDKDKVYMLGTGSNGCTDTSKILEFKVLPSPNFSVNTDSIVCDNENAVLNFSGTSFYNLYKNNTLIKTNISNPYKLNLKDKDMIFIEGVSNQGCKLFSRNIIYKVLTSPLIKIMNPDTDNSHCQGENVIINFSGGTSYDLYKNNVLWKTNTGTSVNFNDATDKDEIFAIGISSNGCQDTSDKIKFTVWPLPAKPSITKTGTTLSSSYTTGNQWYEGTTKLTGANSQNYSPVKSSTYFVDHTDVHGCLSPLSDGYNFSVSILKIKLEGLKIYPNPASDHLIIETGESGKYKLSLIDITGKLIKEEIFIGNHFEWQLKPAKGLYHLKIVNEKGEGENVALEFK